MVNNRIAVVLFTVLSCSALLTGCKNGEKEKALEEVSNLKTQLSKVETKLVQIIGERDALRSEVKTLKQTLALEITGCGG